ncbi:hypothetical protein K5I29_00880 [Flavobacterium agricola]|uniref:Small EDRK-rich factor-like N-terminal domain-containing protein n=1 Tax=Flavobacterium agricola TaxID=2870839 RepID=A0ABY6LZ15_9FLAO|nr:hypothetical protein [Flavobacterium agricola]UYW01526.1 hypothetical protein K5I29_00880 [Flavobacterium agricola]
MGRRNETNRLAHKKKVDQKKTREQEAQQARKEKLKQIIAQHNTNTDA